MRKLFVILPFLLYTTIFFSPVDASEYEHFIEAVRNNDISEMRKMLSDNYKINSIDDDKWTALHWSNFSHELNSKKFCQTLSFLVNHGADVNRLDIHGRNALMIVLSPGIDQINPPSVESIKILINAGTNIYQQNKTGVSALEIGLESEFRAVKHFFQNNNHILNNK